MSDNKPYKIDRKTLESLGLEFVRTPEQPVHAGLFELPPDFPRDKFSAQWVAEDQVAMLQQKSLMPGVGAVAPGLEIYKGKNGKGKPVKVTVTGNKIYVLMTRPKKLQQAMNALYGNVGKTFYNNEIQGNTVAGKENQDSGMIPASQIAQFEQGAASDVEESLAKMNEIKERNPEEVVVVST